MLKNSKMLKGMFLALALVLVLSAGILLNLNANAEGNTVVYYVSDSGNNTTGKDAATAFRTFAAATEAANKLNLAPGTELKIVVVNKVLIQTTGLDQNTVRDSAGNKVHITITSADPANKATILHYVEDPSAASKNEKIHLVNDITFKDIIISAQVQSYYTGNAAIGATIDYSKFYRTRGIHIGSNTVEFDNCEITSTFPSQSGAKNFVLYCDAYASSTVEGASNLRLLNGDYSNCTVYVQDQITPLWDLSLYVENASTGTVYALADTDTSKTANAKSVTCHFKDATVNSYNPQGRGHVGVTNGVTAIFEGDSVIKNWIGAMASSSSTACLDGNLTYIFRDNVSISVTSTDVQEGVKYMYLTPHGTMNGDLHVIVEGGTFNNRLVTGSDTNTKDKQTAVINGTITNEFKGGTFKAGLTLGMGVAGGTVNGAITNTFYDGFHLTSGTSYLGSRGGKCKTTVNTFYGGTIDKVEVYFGGGNGLANTDKNVLDGDLINTFYGGTFGGTAWVGPHSQTVTGGVYNTFMGGTFSTTFVAGGIGLVTPEMYNVFKDGPDGTYATLKGTTCLGVRGKNSSGPNVQSLDRLYNIFEGKVTCSGALYCAGGSQSGGKKINDLVQNDFNGGTFTGVVYCGPRYANDDLSTCDIVNNFNGASFGTNVYGGGLAGTVKSITNNFYKAEKLGATVYGGGAAGTNGDVVNNLYKGMNFTREFYPGGSSSSSTSITNNYMGAAFSASAWRVYAGGTRAENHCGDITNNYYEGTFDFIVHGGGLRGTADSITNNFYGGTFNKYVYCVAERASDKDYAFDVIGDVTNNFYGGTFNSQVTGGGFIGTIDSSFAVTSVRDTGVIYNNWYGGYFKYFVYGGGNGSCYNNKDVVNTVYDGEFNAWLCGGHANSRSIKITNKIYGGYFTGAHKEALHSEAGRTCFYGGDYAAATSGTGQETELVQNEIYGGVFEARVYLGGRIATADKVESMIAGGVFTGDRLQAGMFQHSASNKATVTLDIKPDESDNVLYLGSHYTAYGVEGAKVYYSAGLECLNSRTSDTITLYGAKKPIHIAGNSFLNFDKVLGEVTLIQTENWVDGNDYVTVPDTETLDMIKLVNVDSSITGSAAVTTKLVELEPGGTLKDRVSLVGSATATAPEAISLPGLSAVSFVLDNNLYVNFYTNKADLEAYLSKVGAFSYSVTLGGTKLANGTITSMDDAEIVGEYVKIRSNLAVEAFNYSNMITIDFAGNTASYSVYGLLEEGVTASAQDAALANLLKAAYNYGVAAEELRYGTASATAFDDVTYTGDYSGKASATTADGSYKFIGTGLSLGKDVSMNFYMKAETLDGLTFTAASAKGALDASRITVTPFAGNSQYNVVVTLKLDIASMSEVFTLTALNAEGTAVATCTNSVAYGCMTYINQNNEYTPVSKALLTYVEKAVEYVASR